MMTQNKEAKWCDKAFCFVLFFVFFDSFYALLYGTRLILNELVLFAYFFFDLTLLLHYHLILIDFYIFCICIHLSIFLNFYSFSRLKTNVQKRKKTLKPLDLMRKNCNKNNFITFAFCIDYKQTTLAKWDKVKKRFRQKVACTLIQLLLFDTRMRYSPIVRQDNRYKFVIT